MIEIITQELCCLGCNNIAKYKPSSTKRKYIGKLYCSDPANQCPVSLLKRKNSKKGKIPWNKGLTKNTHSSLEKQSNTYKNNIATGKYIPHTFSHKEETKKKYSEYMKKRYLSGWESPNNRVKTYKYSSPIAGEVYLDGGWELKVAKFFDSNKVNWRRNTKRFNYIKPNGIVSTYKPDFYLPDQKLYIEVKGYETELDHAKWDYFLDKLWIWREFEINNLSETYKLAEVEGFEPPKERY